MSALGPRGSTRAWRRLRALVLDRDAHRCQVPTGSGQLCGAYASHVDHVLPRSKGGGDVPANLRAACRSCNLRRGNRATPPPTAQQAPPIHLGWRW